MLVVRDLTFHRGPLKIFEGISLSLSQGRKLALLGASGCGKTTLLRLIAGFEKVQKGEISLRGELVGSSSCHLSAYERKVGFVFQNYALFPHLTVFENIVFGVTSPRGDAGHRLARELMDVFEISQLRDKRPFEISGGEQQRVAIVRALVPEPQLLLLDEPLAHLDSELRSKLVRELRERLDALGVTSILVTHSQKEAFEFCDDLVVMTKGGCFQTGEPRFVYENPICKEVAEMTGEGAYFANRVTSERRLSNIWGTFDVGPQSLSAETSFFVRPESVIPGTSVRAILKRITFRGADYLLEFRSLESGEEIFMVRSIHDKLPELGSEVGLSLDPRALLCWIDGEELGR